MIWLFNCGLFPSSFCCLVVCLGIVAVFGTHNAEQIARAMSGTGKLSMAEFKLLRQAKSAVAAGRAREREGNPGAARKIYEEAVASAPGEGLPPLASSLLFF